MAQHGKTRWQNIVKTALASITQAANFSPHYTSSSLEKQKNLPKQTSLKIRNDPKTMEQEQSVDVLTVLGLARN